MEVQHNTTLLEKAVEYSVRNASIPARKAEAAARQVEARAQGFRRLATGGAIALAAAGIGFGIWLAMQPPRDDTSAAHSKQVEELERELGKEKLANETLRQSLQTSEQQLAAFKRQKDESRVLPGDLQSSAEQEQKISQQQQALAESEKTIADLRRRLDSITGRDPLSDYSIFKYRFVTYKGQMWKVTAGHQFASSLDKNWSSGWCYVSPEIDNVRLNVDLVTRSTPDSSPVAPVASPQTLQEAGLDREDAIFLASNCEWLDGRVFTAAELGGGKTDLKSQPSISRDGDSLLYSGEIDQDFVNLLKSASFSKLVITSDGGSIPQSIDAGTYLRSRRATVEVRDRCFSACVFVVAGGERRYSEDGAKIGVHQFYFSDSTDSNSATALAQQTASAIVQYLSMNGVDPELFHTMVKIPSNEILVLPTDKLLAWHLLTGSPGETGHAEEVSVATTTETNTQSLKRHVFQARDMMGGDDSVLKNVTQEACETSCRADTVCKGYTYDKWNRVCLIKSGLGLLRLEPRSVTVVFTEPQPRESASPAQMTRRNGRVFPDAPYRTVAADTFEQCSDTCLGERQCLGVNYRATGQCELIRSPSEYSPSAGVTLAIKSQASSTP